MKIISIYNNKGGVGKSTSVINIASILSEIKKYKVLVIDGDGQRNTSRFFTDDERNIGIEASLLTQAPPSAALCKTRYPNIDVAISSAKMNDAAIEFDKLSPDFQRGQFAKLRSFWQADYDYIIIDLPPTLNNITKGFLSISDDVIVPIELGTFAIQGIANVTETINKVNAKFCGCFVSKFDKNNPADFSLLELLNGTLGNKAFETSIPFSRVIKNSISYKLTALEYMEWAEAVQDYIKLTDEIIEKVGK